MTTVFVSGFLVGVMLSSGIALLLLLRVLRHLDAKDELFNELILHLHEFEELQVPSDQAFDSLVSELVVSIVTRVNSKLPSFLPSSTRVSINYTLDQTIKHDVATMVDSYVAELVSVIKAKQSSNFSTMIKKLEDQWRKTRPYLGIRQQASECGMRLPATSSGLWVKDERRPDTTRTKY